VSGERLFARRLAFPSDASEKELSATQSLERGALAVAAPFAWAQVSETTTTQGSGTIPEYTTGSTIVLKETSGPRTYRFGRGLRAKRVKLVYFQSRLPVLPLGETEGASCVHLVRKNCLLQRLGNWSDMMTADEYEHLAPEKRALCDVCKMWTDA
jgi:hypothetical protein